MSKHKHTQSNLETLPPIRFVGPHAEPELNVELAGYMEKRRRYKNERPLTPELEDGIGGILVATKEYAATELGIDVSPRFPRLANIHILTKEDMRKEFPWLQEYDKKLDIYGLAVGGPDVVLRECSDKADLPVTLHVAQHEIIHSLSRQTIQPEVVWRDASTREISMKRVGSGFQVGHERTFSVLDEFVTEKTTQEIMRYYWNGQEVLPPGMAISDREGHEVSLEVGNEIVRKIHERTSRSEIDIFRGLQREYFLGGTTERRVMAEVMGYKVMRQLARIPSQDANAIKIS